MVKTTTNSRLSLEGQSTVHHSVDCTHGVSRLILPLSNPVSPLTLGQSTVDSLSRLLDLQSTDFECQSTASLVLCQSTELARLWEEFPLRQSTDYPTSRLPPLDSQPKLQFQPLSFFPHTYTLNTSHADFISLDRVPDNTSHVTIFIPNPHAPRLT